MGLRILDLSGYCGTVYGRQQRTEDEVSAFLEGGCSCPPGFAVASPWGADHFPNSSVDPHQVSRRFQNPRSLESLKSKRLLIAKVEIYNGRHFFPRTESLCPLPRAASPRIRMNTDAEHRAHGVLKGDEKRHSCSTATTEGRISPLHRAWVCTAMLRCLGVFISCPLHWPLPILPTPSPTFTQSSPGNGQFNWLSSMQWHSHSGPAFLWLHPNFLPWLEFHEVHAFQSLDLLPRVTNHIHCLWILLLIVQLWRWPCVPGLQIHGEGDLPLLLPYLAKTDVQNEDSTSFPALHQSL